MSDYLNRVDAINDTTSGTTTLAEYLYLGAGFVIRITYPEPGIWLDLWGGTSGIVRRNRPVRTNHRPAPGKTTSPERQKTLIAINTATTRTPTGSGRPTSSAQRRSLRALMSFMCYDPLNRLTEMQRGVLERHQHGNHRHAERRAGLDARPDRNWSELCHQSQRNDRSNQTRTANTVNEITNITEATGPTWVVPTFDDAGNTTTMPQVTDPTQSFTAVYDAWNRKVSIAASGTAVAAYQYDGRNFRIVKNTYASGVLAENRDFYFTNSWQDIEERVGTSTSMAQQYVWGLRYIDELICRDDATPQRLYAAQDANFNVTCISNISSTVVERYLYDPYGNSTIMDAEYDSRPSSAFSWGLCYQGLGTDSESQLISARSRDVTSIVGRFLTRDAMGYIDGLNEYEFNHSSPELSVDPFGYAATKCCCCCVEDMTISPTNIRPSISEGSARFTVSSKYQTHPQPMLKEK